uniref:Transcription factor 25 n=1 Tax=Meloidogyne incognita TaxID=6306 RepID=A0A914MIM4_MELIC
MEESDKNISDNNEQKDSDGSKEILSFESKFCVLLENQNEATSLDKGEDVVDLNIKLENVKRKKKYNKRKIRKKSLDNEIDELVKLIESKNELNKELGNEEIEELSNLNENEEENIIDKLLNINLNILKESTNIVSLNNLESQIKTSFESKLVDVQRNWPSLRNLEFRMIFDSFGNNKDIKWFRFWNNETYQRQQQFFHLCYRERRYSDILNIILNKQNPYHLDSLLLMADLIQNEDNNERANDFIERGIYALEAAFHPHFNLCSSNYRLDYSWKENRPFFLLLYRYLLKNIEKNNLKTSLEIAKVLFAKDFEGDPLGILLLIDSLALRANCPNFLLDFYEYFLKSKRLDLLPNFRFSISLALHLLGMEDEAVRNFEEALVAFPFILSQILDFLQIRADPLIESNYYLNTLASYREPEGLLLLVRIYLHHSNKIWSDPVILNWLEITTHKVLPRLQSVRKREIDQWAKKRKQLFTGLPENIARHCLINGLSIPETLVVDAKLNLGECIQINPCPPKVSQQGYLDKEVSEEMDRSQQSNLNERNFGLIVSFLRSILPERILEILCRFIQRFIP